MPTVYIIGPIKIDVYSREHLPPHFHVIYAEYEILIEIKTLSTYAGSMPVRQYRVVLEWAHNKETQKFLLEIFERLNPELRR